MYTLDPEEHGDMIEQFHTWAKDKITTGNGHNSYWIISSHEDKLTKTEYLNRPCWGEMRPYQKTHPKEVTDSVRMPSDLSIRFPDGNPVGLGVVMLPQTIEYLDEYRSWVFSLESPWRSVMSEIDIRRNEDGKIISVFFLNTKIDPTVLVCALQASREAGNHRLRSVGVKGTPLFLTSHLLQHNYPEYGKITVAKSHDYYVSGDSNIIRVMRGEPCQISINANTLFERGVYNRPKNMKLFVDGEHTIDKLNWWEKNKGKIITQDTVVKELIPAIEEYTNGTSDSRG